MFAMFMILVVVLFTGQYTDLSKDCLINLLLDAETIAKLKTTYSEMQENSTNHATQGTSTTATLGE